MTEYEAILILGLQKTKYITQADVNKSFSRKVGVNHPDRGGSRYLMEKIVEAKEMLKKK